MKNTLLTIDWDYFVPEKLEWDMQHSESLLYLKHLWPNRGPYFKDIIKTNGEEIRWWDRLHRRGYDISEDTIYVSDSHLFAANLGTYDQILTIDAHHDMWPPSVDDPNATLWCENWLRQYLQLNPDTKAYWVQAEWAKEDFGRIKPDDPDYTDLWERVEEGWPEEADITCIHICRSGCWTPPWLDDQFLEFVNDPLLPTVSLQKGEWDPLISRWDDQMRAAIERWAEIGKLVMESNGEKSTTFSLKRV